MRIGELVNPLTLLAGQQVKLYQENSVVPLGISIPVGFQQIFSCSKTRGPYPA